MNETYNAGIAPMKHGVGVRIADLEKRIERLQAEATRTTAQLEKLDEAGQTAITDWPKGSSQPQFGDGLDRLLDLPGELERLQAELDAANVDPEDVVITPPPIESSRFKLVPIDDEAKETADGNN